MNIRPLRQTFVIAHEIAHHKLGHMKMFPDSFSINLANNIKILLAGKYRLIESRLYGPEQECDADRLAIEMCIAAGYDPFECIEIFDKFEKIALDRNDLGAVFGPDEADDELASAAQINAQYPRVSAPHRLGGRDFIDRSGDFSFKIEY